MHRLPTQDSLVLRELFLRCLNMTSMHVLSGEGTKDVHDVYSDAIGCWADTVTLRKVQCNRDVAMS